MMTAERRAEVLATLQGMRDAMDGLAMAFTGFANAYKRSQKRDHEDAVRRWDAFQRRRGR